MSFALAPNLPNIVGDATQLRQVLMNLVLNASEAVGDRAGTIAIRTGVVQADGEFLQSFSAERLASGPYVSLEVEDNGAGMSEETRARIFDPFFSTKFTGRGLGLSAVLGIVRGHQGALRVNSELGKGSRFTMLVPVDSSVHLESLPTALPSTLPRYSGTVLLADDEDSVLSVTREMLERIGFDVLTVRDGEDALRACREKGLRLAFVVMDLTMPRLDGREALLELRSRGDDTLVILMSGYSEQQAMGRFSDIRGVSFLQKPFTLEELQTKVAGALDRLSNR